MLEFLDTNIKWLVGIRFSGAPTAAHADEIIEVFEAKLNENEIVNFYVEVESASNAAVVEQARKLFGAVLPNLSRLQKVALITDDPSLRTSARIENHSFTAEMKSFSSGEKWRARDWAGTMETYVDILER